MSKNLSRRDFLKGSAAGMLGVAAASLMNAPLTFAEESGTYTPGTYSATATGIGTVTVQMTFDAENITKAVVDVSEETPTIGGLHGQELAEAIIAAQGAEIDAITGATTTSAAVAKAAAACIAQAKGEAVEVAAPAAAPAAATEEDSLIPAELTAAEVAGSIAELGEIKQDEVVD